MTTEVDQEIMEIERRHAIRRGEHEQQKTRRTSRLGALDTVALPTNGDYPCVSEYRCGNRVKLPGICGDCVARQEREDRHAALARARGSVPAMWRWAKAGAPEMPLRMLGAPQAPAALVTRTLARILETARRALAEHHLLVLWGDSGVGKTSLATALLHEIIIAGEDPAAPLAALNRARLTRFLDAAAIHGLEDLRTTVGDKADVEDFYFFEKKSSTLLVDNLGIELDGCPPNTPLASMKIKASKQLVSTRIAEKRDTIITMWMERAEVTRVYGGGFSRLLFEVGPWAIELPRLPASGARR
jgi:hypothetical protein